MDSCGRAAFGVGIGIENTHINKILIFNNMQSKLGLDFKKVEQAKGLAKSIASEVQTFVEGYTTVAVERTLCRLLGIDGVDANQVPLPNVVVDDLKSKGVLNEGVIFYIGNAMAQTGKTPQEIAEAVADGSLDLTRIEVTDKDTLQKVLKPVVDSSVERIRTRRTKKENIFMLLLLQVTYMRMLFRLRLLHVRVRILLQLSVLPVRVFWTMCRTVPQQRALAVHLLPRRTSELCVLRWMR